MYYRLPDEIHRRLTELGVKVQASPARGRDDHWGLVELSRGRSSANFLTSDLPTLTLAAARELVEWVAPDQRLLVSGPVVHERSAQAFRELGINFIDEAGNASINFDDVLIDIRGRRFGATPMRATESRSIVGATNLFTLKRSQVIFVALERPEILTSSVRDIARAAGVSVGQAQQTLEALEIQGFLGASRALNEHRVHTLVDMWVASFSSTLGGSKRTSRWISTAPEIRPASDPVYISGEAAVPEMIRSPRAVIYTNTKPTELAIKNRWRRGGSEANIFVREAFWNFDDDQGPMVHTAPGLLVYADLMTHEDPRTRATADEFRTKHLGALGRR